MSWKNILKEESLAEKADILVDEFTRKVRLPYVLIASRSELLGWKSHQSPEDAPRHIKHFAKLLDVHRDKIPKESQNDLDELIEKLNGLVRELE